jgi:peptide/nickel transport system substrate-binding protein
LRPPFDNPEIRKAMALVLDRRAFVDVLSEGRGNPAIAMQPPPGGLWGTPPEMLVEMPGYGMDVAERQAQAVETMKRLGYGPAQRLTVKVSTRDMAPYRDPAIILIDQLKKVFIDSELEVLDTMQWFEGAAKDYTVALHLT